MSPEPPVSSSEPLTPVAVEAKLRFLYNELARAQLALANARDAEVDAKHAVNAARRRALLSAECPKVARGGYTTAERDAWVEDKAHDLQVAYDRKSAAREAAQDHLRVVRDQAEIFRSLGASVRQSYEMAGHS